MPQAVRRPWFTWCPVRGFSPYVHPLEMTPVQALTHFLGACSNEFIQEQVNNARNWTDLMRKLGFKFRKNDQIKNMIRIRCYVSKIDLSAIEQRGQKARQLRDARRGRISGLADLC